MHLLVILNNHRELAKYVAQLIFYSQKILVVQPPTQSFLAETHYPPHAAVLKLIFCPISFHFELCKSVRKAGDIPGLVVHVWVLTCLSETFSLAFLRKKNQFKRYF